METVYCTASKLLKKKLHQIYWLNSIISSGSRTASTGHFPNSPLLQWWLTETSVSSKTTKLEHMMY